MKRIELLSLALLMAFGVRSQNKNAPVNYDESKVPTFEVPDILKCEDGVHVETVKQWEKKRRPELLRMFSEQEYGVTPQQTGIKVRYEVLGSNPKAMNDYKQEFYVAQHGLSPLSCCAVGTRYMDEHSGLNSFCLNYKPVCDTLQPSLVHFSSRKSCPVQRMHTGCWALFPI